MKHRIALASTAVILIALAGFGVGKLADRMPVPDMLATPTPVTVVPTQVQEFSDPRLVELVASRPGDPSLITRADGIVTGSACTIGAEPASGSTTFWVNSAPLLNLATAYPMWRELAIGDEGDDVAGLQTALSSLGLDVPIDGVLGPRTLRAFNDLARAAAPAAPWVETVSPSGLIWLPPGSRAVLSCDVGVGGQVSPGSALATLPPQLSSIAVRVLPSSLAHGDRVIVVDGERVPVAPDGSIVDLADIGRLAATPLFSQYESDPEGVVLRGTLELERPVIALAVPPSAIFGVQGDRGCVVAAGVVRQGTLLGSELGYTLMEFPGAAVTAVEVGSASPPPCP